MMTSIAHFIQGERDAIVCRELLKAEIPPYGAGERPNRLSTIDGVIGDWIFTRLDQYWVATRPLEGALVHFEYKLKSGWTGWSEPEELSDGYRLNDENCLKKLGDQLRYAARL